MKNVHKRKEKRYQVLSGGFNVRLRSKSGQSVFVYKHTKRITARYQHIDTQIKLEIVDQKGLHRKRRKVRKAFKEATLGKRK